MSYKERKLRNEKNKYLRQLGTFEKIKFWCSTVFQKIIYEYYMLVRRYHVYFNVFRKLC